MMFGNRVGNTSGYDLELFAMGDRNWSENVMNEDANNASDE